MALLIALPAVGCGGGGSSGPQDVPCGGRNPLVQAVGALCEAEDAPRPARAIFLDRSHEALHTLAARVDSGHRAAAADLLVAMERVENRLNAPGSPQQTRRAIESLKRAAGRALDAIGLEPPRCGG